MKSLELKSSGRVSVALLCLAALMVAVISVREVIAEDDTGSHSVTARIDPECKSRPATFKVPEARTAFGFKVKGPLPGKKCHGEGPPENVGFSIRDGRGKIIYMWSKYKDQKPYEKGGPLEKLTLGSGEYTLTVAGGAGAEVTLSHELK